MSTARMVGRRPTTADLGLYDELLNNAAVARTMGGHRTHEQLSAALERHLAAWERYGFGPALLFDRETGGFVGRGGLNRVTVLGADEVEVGYALLPAYWGRGLATEIGRASIATGFDDLGCDSVVGFTLVDNATSRHVLEKCGMSFEREFVHSDLPHVLLRVRPAEFVNAEPVG
jgi:[ribosomal protein S5]-alanine N-acetyltransferase